jgi:hypothetical protein
MESKDPPEELERKIEQARRIASGITDRTTLERLKGFIEELRQKLGESLRARRNKQEIRARARALWEQSGRPMMHLGQVRVICSNVQSTVDYYMQQTPCGTPFVNLVSPSMKEREGNIAERVRERRAGRSDGLTPETEQTIENISIAREMVRVDLGADPTDTKHDTHRNRQLAKLPSHSHRHG